MRAFIGRLTLLIVLVAPTVSAAQGPVRIGFISPLSGAIAQAGKDMYSGCELYWKYNPEEFLKQPVYSREFPPCKYC